MKQEKSLRNEQRLMLTHESVKWIDMTPITLKLAK